MINDALLANPEDRLRDLAANIEEIKMILKDIQAMLDDNDEYDNATEAIVEIDHALEFLDSAFDSVDEAGDLLEL
ncbi:hypothetical protein [Ruminococcus sp. 5_1_39BFAA]|uniref:hypothetical protein n=1 Tax=Ruminococcus sp. 5_1_39BFAA TaxID=457412 RepID=UPI003562EA3F